MDRTSPYQSCGKDDNSKNVKTERETVDDAKLHRENVNHPKHRQTASYDKESVVPSSIVPGPSSASCAGPVPIGTKESKMDSSKIASMQQIVENTLSQEGRQRVSQLLEAVEALSGAERLLLYLRLPTGVPPHDPLKQPVNPLGSRAELQQTVTWIQTHLEVDPDVSLPKQDVYDEYIAHCMNCNMKPLSTADFGKVMKQVYPTVRPRRLGTRGNSRYCYAGLRKKVKLEAPHLPDLGESSKEFNAPSKESERIVCDWAETKFGPTEDAPGPQLIKQLKRKLQGSGTPGRPKKNKGQDTAGVSPPSTSYMPQLAVKHESEMAADTGYGYQPAYVPVYDVRPPFPYTAPPLAHPPHAPPVAPHDYRPDPYAFDPPYAPRDLTVPADAAHNLPINLSSDASLDLSTERTEWQRRRPPDPPAARMPPLPGKKLILETYQSETQAGSPRPLPAERPPAEEFPRAEYLPKKMRAAEMSGGKLAAARQAALAAEPPTSSAAPGADALRSEVAFLEDPKNLTNRSTSTAAALAREELEAASPTRSVKAPTPKSDRTRARKPGDRAGKLSPTGYDGPVPPDAYCGLDGINIKTGVICDEKHSEIFNRERVISICNIDKHDLDDYLNEGNSQEHEEELMQYFHRGNAGDASDNSGTNPKTFLDASRDPPDDHSQGKNEKLSQLRELLAKNLKNQSGSNSIPQSSATNEGPNLPLPNDHLSELNKGAADGAFKPVNSLSEVVNGSADVPDTHDCTKSTVPMPNENGVHIPETTQSLLLNTIAPTQLYNGNVNHEPQSPTTRTQQYDFVPISEGCHSPANVRSKSPSSSGPRGSSPSKAAKLVLCGSLQTSPNSHSTAASPFVSPRNTPVPRSRLFPRPIPKHNEKRRRNALTLGVNDSCPKPFAIPNDQKYLPRTALNSNIKYCQPMSAPPSPNILTNYKNQLMQSGGITNGTNHMSLNFVPNLFRDSINGDLAQPLSADPLSSEVSQFFQEPVVNYRLHDVSFRSQSVPLKQATLNVGLLSYNNTPVGSVPPTPVPNEFSDFGSLAETCDISKAGLNPETLDKIYDAIDSSNDVLNTAATTDLLNPGQAITNGCDPLPDRRILAEEQMHPFIATGPDLLDRNAQFDDSFSGDANAEDNVEEFLKRTNSIEFDLSDLVTEKSRYYTSRSVPSTPLPYKRTAPNLQIDSRRSREPFAADFDLVSNGISSKSVPSTPQLPEDRSVFSYSNRDYLINGNSVEVMCGPNQMNAVVESDQTLASPLDMLREDILEPLSGPTADLLADFDKIDGPPYVVDL
ncbi:uncharacterized protein LOC121729314 isoform X2 [Aricia agestis]|uniref:uncharacterized protein LOC121729314 isoform X2 n=1 Tax=Aricia agestis TaxID=91739 RepID=UPI001C2053B2|nr:uncharacterized protein LOC121729314 isoform X2 [Aricia agestis]